MTNASVARSREDVTADLVHAAKLVGELVIGPSGFPQFLLSGLVDPLGLAFFPVGLLYAIDEWLEPFDARRIGRLECHYAAPAGACVVGARS